MNLGQTMITLGMFVLLIMTVISANRILLENAETTTKTDPSASASVLANNLFSEIMSKPFDKAVVIDDKKDPWRQDTTGAKVGAVNDLTPYGTAQWGVKSRVTLPDDTTGNSGKYRSQTELRDIDDYDGYSRIARVVIWPLDTLTYTLSVRVYYAVYTAPDDTTSTAQQFFKKINVTVTQSRYGLTEKYSALASY